MKQLLKDMEFADAFFQPIDSPNLVICSILEKQNSNYLFFLFEIICQTISWSQCEGQTRDDSQLESDSVVSV